MRTGELRSQIDQIWNAFWSGGISNPLEVIEQIAYPLFLRRLDDCTSGRSLDPAEHPLWLRDQAPLYIVATAIRASGGRERGRRSTERTEEKW